MSSTKGVHGPDEEYFRRNEKPRPLRAGVPATWGSRAFALILDVFLVASPLLLIPLARALDLTDAEGRPTGTAGNTMFAIALVGTVGMLFWQMIREGGTGQSFGKTVAGIRTVGFRTGRPIGPMIFFRYALRPINALFFGLGYLWAIWDERSQTFVDKILETVVVDA